jgi:NAD(P)-dependent dehydrogenase (short-subunit alcohol dehydrogenase family)
VLITGASTGIGEACALHLDKLGFRVFAGVRKAADADALRQKASPRLTPVMIDVTDATSIASAAETVGQAVGEFGLSGLVNNAGIAVVAPMEFVLLDDLRRQLEVNTIGQVAVTQAFLPLLRRAKGRIVNISSQGGRFVFPLFGPYSMSKFALEAFSDALRRELRGWGMHVAVVEAGSIATPIWSKGIATAGSIRDKLPAQAEPLYGRMMDTLRAGALMMGARGIPPETVARAVAHALTSRFPRTRYLVGLDAQVIARLAWLLPDRVMDWIMACVLGLCIL